jgi:hypothetical protein
MVKLIYLHVASSFATSKQQIQPVWNAYVRTSHATDTAASSLSGQVSDSTVSNGILHILCNSKVYNCF